MKKVIKIDLDDKEQTKLLNSSEVARVINVSSQWTGRVLRQETPGKKIKKELLRLFGTEHRAA